MVIVIGGEARTVEPGIHEPRVGEFGIVECHRVLDSVCHGLKVTNIKRSQRSGMLTDS
jgi:hypothetical protein